MQQMFLGEALKKRRMELGLTQEQLCEGICEPATISRFENGRQTPSRNRINALLERLGLPGDRYFALSSENELEIEALQRQITTYNFRFERACSDERAQIREQAQTAYRELEALIEDDDMLSRQMLLRSKVIIGKRSGEYSPDEQKEMLNEAIRLTAPYFNVLNIGKGLYSVDEIKLICLLASAYSHNDQHTEALNIYSQLYEYIKKHFANIPQTRANLSMVSANYARELTIAGDFQKAVEIAKEGQQTCLDYGHYHSLPLLVAIQGDAYHRLGNDIESRKLYYQAYYLMLVTNDNHNLQILKRKAKNELGLEFED